MSGLRSMRRSAAAAGTCWLRCIRSPTSRRKRERDTQRPWTLVMASLLSVANRVWSKLFSPNDQDEFSSGHPPAKPQAAARVQLAATRGAGILAPLLLLFLPIALHPAGQE